MTKIDIFSGFLGAGKTTLIKKLIKEAYTGEKLVLIENEFGEIGIDGTFMQDAGIEVTEMNSGCICCSLVGDFSKALVKVMEEYAPTRIIIEPSGVGKLSDVIKAVMRIDDKDMRLNTFTTVADANKCKMYMKNFGEFYNDQIESASCIVLSRTQDCSEEKLETAVKLISEKNSDAVIVTTPWDELDGKQILEAMENKETLKKEIDELKHEEHEHHHHHDDDDECCCEHDHDHEHHHHHDDNDECCCGHDHDHEHHHHHDDDDECCCGHDHDHEHEHHHHHHHADEVFTSWGRETIKKFTKEQISAALKALDSGEYGVVLRAKGVVAGEDGKWIHFDHVPGEADVREGSSSVIGRLCVIGSKLDEEKISELFGVK